MIEDERSQMVKQPNNCIFDLIFRQVSIYRTLKDLKQSIYKAAILIFYYYEVYCIMVMPNTHVFCDKKIMATSPFFLVFTPRQQLVL